MGGELQWAGTAAAALIAIATVVRWTWLRIVRYARWARAMTVLPEAVGGLQHSVETLTGSVDTLSRALHRHPSPIEETTPDVRS